MNNQTKCVGDVMTKHVATLRRNDKLLVADDVMGLGRVRHLPVLDEDGNVAGIVSQRDLCQSALVRALGYGSHARQEALDGLLVKAVMKTEVVTTTAETTLADAARIMLEKKIGCLVVLEGDKLVGILTESDFVKLALES